MSKQNRRERLKEIIEAAKNIPDPNDAGIDNAEAAVKEYWPKVKPFLEWVEEAKWTRANVDKVLEKVIVIGDQIASNDPNADVDEFTEKLAKIWKVIRVGLSISTVWLDDKQDEAVEKIIQVGNIITGMDKN